MRKIMNNLQSFILLDDDPNNNMFSEITITKSLMEADISFCRKRIPL